ncbi:MAG: hypothetical protein LBT60_04605, partial [Oscillospiraceae bacterium]|nr:hypothetical protein [Oscillospiraceae bacterium]
MTLLLAAGLVLSASCAPVTPGGGFSARVSLEDGPSAALICEETGFADSFPFDQAGVDALLYDENGKLASEYT